jgi:hypothetical protein
MAEDLKGITVAVRVRSSSACAVTTLFEDELVVIPSLPPAPSFDALLRSGIVKRSLVFNVKLLLRAHIL